MRVTDLLNIDRQLNVTGDSVLNLLMRPDSGTDQLHNARSRSNQSSSEHFDMNRRTARRRELVGDSVYCVAISQLCNQLNECPNGEDEDDCPRPRGNLLDILRYYKNMDTTHTSDISSTTTRSTVQSRKEREEAEDEFHHHPSIIIGLLGFCAICGLLSAGMTLVNRGKQDKRGNFSSVCNGVLFDSGTSLITTLEEGSVLHLDTRNGETSKFNVPPVKTVDSSGNSTVVHGRPEQTEKFRGRHDCFFGLICPVFNRRKKRKGIRSKSDPNNPSLPVGEIMNNPDGTESIDRKAKGSCSSADLRDYSASREVASHNCIEAFDRTIVPVTNVTCASSGRNELLLPQLSEEHSRTLLQRKVPSGELISRATVNMSRSTAASFGHLPNTIVCPVEKLSDAIYHCGIIPPGSTLNRTIWNRSGPLPLVNERDLTFPENYPYETLKTSKSAKCLIRRFSTDKHAISAFDFTNSEQRAYNESIDEVTRTGTPSIGFPTPDFPVRNMQSSRMRNQLIDSRCTLYGRWGLDETQYNAEREDLTFVERRTTGLTGRRKSFKGGAPKRARYSFDPMNEPALPNPNTLETADHISRQADNDAQEVQAALQWTSSCSTSGELLDSGQSGREAAPRGWWKSPSKNNPSSRAPYWVGHTVGGKMVVGPSGTPSEDISLADLNESEIASNLIYRCDSSSLGSHLKTCRPANTSNMDEIRIPTSIRASNKPEAHFKVTVVAKTRSSQSSDLRAGSGGGKPGIFGTTAAQSESRRDSGPSPGVSSVAPIQRYCDCALQSNDLVYRSHTRTPHLQGGGYGPMINSFTSSTPDKRAAECVPELDDSEDTATQNYSEETESGTNSDDRLANNSIERRENHVWRASDEHTVRNDGNVKTNQTVNEGNSKRATNTTTIIITSRDGARQIYREEQL
ncbi:hypothetical protein FGIG_03906 [Fasciola gigantica]|uniref:Uncharacterized protein n=1 Tax=Fasciola gigantica TaxID=46835 RepID=A0A504Z329_FASGI|nr:hypothetical protein FGIG_03906 [Fasciola gigantica]